MSATHLRADAAATVCAAIVTCAPDLAELRIAVAAITGQVARLLIVDNATRDDGFTRFLQEELPANAEVIRNARNQGLGAAINAAFAWAREHGCDDVLLLDQDSAACEQMVQRLLDARARLATQGPVAAVGPAYVDAHTAARAPFVRLGFPFNRKMRCDDGVVACDFLITSGSLIALDAFRDVGPMDAALFIDNIDVEWCFRATRKGYRLFGVGAACMRHRLGDSVRVIPWVGNVVVHSPTRLYYMMRNRVLLYRRAATPRIWIAQDIPRLVFKLLCFGLLVAPRLRNARAMLLGIADGVRGRSGPIRNVQ